MNLLTVKWQDVAGRKGTFSMHVDPAYLPTDVELLAAIQAMRNLSECQILEASLAVKIDISGLTNPAASSAGDFSRIDDQAILQYQRADGAGFTSLSVPGPLNTIFDQTGAYQEQAVDAADSLVTAFNAAVITEPVLQPPVAGVLTFNKGWRKGQKHP